MRITYETLAKIIAKMTVEQKNSDVTVEMPDDDVSECFSAELRLASEDAGLDDNHPVIYVHVTDEPHVRRKDVDNIISHMMLNS